MNRGPSLTTDADDTIRVAGSSKNECGNSKQKIMLDNYMNNEGLPPRTLFKYRYFDTAGYNLRSLDEMFFSAPERFNDPYDTSIPVLYHSSGTNPNIILEYMRRTNPETNPRPLQDWEIIESWKQFISKIPADIKKAQDLDQVTADNNTRSTGAFSLAESEFSILMWSHYALHHTGFCIAYRTNVLYEALRKYKEVIIVPIEYHAQCPIINPYDPNLDLNDWFSPFKVKHSDWAYEKEWRIILLNGANQIIPIPENAIEAVYLGMRIQKNDEDMLIGKLRARNIKVNLYEAKRQFNNFEIRFENVEY